MAEKKRVNVTIQPKKTYFYIIEGETRTKTFILEDRDVLINADGDIDCPLESVLRKNNTAMADLREWGVTRILLIEKTNESEKVLYEFDSEYVLNLLQA